eukprot:6098636-Prymnesium_polylepis.1
MRRVQRPGPAVGLERAPEEMPRRHVTGHVLHPGITRPGGDERQRLAEEPPHAAQVHKDVVLRLAYQALPRRHTVAGVERQSVNRRRLRSGLNTGCEVPRPGS